MKPTVSKVEFTASTRSLAFAQKRKQVESICKERKGKRDTITSTALQKAQLQASSFFTKSDRHSSV